MAQIQINVDTDTKVLAVTINGTLIPDIDDVCVYSYRDSNGNVSSLDVSMQVTTKTVDGVDIRVSYYASGSVKAQSAIASGQKVYNNLKGFVGIEESAQAAQDINEFILARKHAI